jgi:hypothetical protein
LEPALVTSVIPPIVHRDRLRHGVVGVAEDEHRCRDALQLGIDIHAVMRQQDHRIDLSVLRKT